MAFAKPPHLSYIFDGQCKYIVIFMSKRSSLLNTYGLTAERLKRIFHSSPQKIMASGGFALVATLLLLTLLVALVLILLGVVRLESRSTQNMQQLAQARHHALTGLEIAIGELQGEIGPDQRITANGGILTNDSGVELDEDSPVRHWTGVWNSWYAGSWSPPVGDPSETPDVPSEHSTINGATNSGMAPTYERNREDHFRSWLVSLTDDDKSTLASDLYGEANSFELDPDTDPTAIILVGKGTLGNSIDTSEYVHARLLDLNTDRRRPSVVTGRYGWWVSDESQKAKVMDNPYDVTNTTNLAERLFRQQAPAAIDISEIPGLDNLANTEQLSFLPPSMASLPVVNGVEGEPVKEQFHDITTASFGVLADVREGGLKRDLSTLLERRINQNEVYTFSPVSGTEFTRATGLRPSTPFGPGGDEFMLYNFDNIVDSDDPTGEAAVPIQDLAAYYQLYDRYRIGSMGGIQYSSQESSPSNNLLQEGIMVSNPDYGETQTDIMQYLRQYTSLYRNPVPVKIEMILNYAAEPIFPIPTDPNDDRYNLRIGVSPAITLWNPNNVPLVMNSGNPDRASIMFRETPIPLRITFRKLDGPGGTELETVERQFNDVTSTQQGELYTFFISGNFSTVFEPGESKVFALQYASQTNATSANGYVDFLLRGGRGSSRYNEAFVDELELVPGWNPERFIRPEVDVGGQTSGRSNPIVMTFKDTDYISATIDVGGYNTFTIDFTQKSRHGRNSPGVKWHFRSGMIRGRLDADSVYRDSIVYQGFPDTGGGISDTTPRTIEIAERSAQTIIDSMGSIFNPRDDLPNPFFYYGIKAASETHESVNMAGGSIGSGRRFPARPFLHSPALYPAFIDSSDPASLYNYGWNWFFLPLDNIFDAPVEISIANSGYFGGGYTALNGTTHVVQQQLPITPLISIASLSHAHLGGFSLATEAPVEGYAGLSDQSSDRFRRTTAVGFGGLAPQTLQAIGNSYAHPNIPADRAMTTWEREFQNGSPVQEPFADHSYLANKALWDQFFFSSISPSPDVGDVYGTNANRTAAEVAEDFFANVVEDLNGNGTPLPNPRIVPYAADMDGDTFNDLFSQTVTSNNDPDGDFLPWYSEFTGGTADRIAAHLMVEGPFNVNSTSVTAWQAFFSSLKEQEVYYLDSRSALTIGTDLDSDPVDGVPIPGGPLPSGRAYRNSPSNPSNADQWAGFRELTDTEIQELAEAMVEQVRLRGPFLSVSDFINRRLDASNTALALKGALQAAIDNTSINEGFRSNTREFSAQETSFISAAFPDALEGPIAYGSSPYVDQADLLKNFPAQLTPRGDTFVIRAYGDSRDPDGNVIARAWCEAVVQRVPEYVEQDSNGDGTIDSRDDQPHEAQAELDPANARFGRELKIVSFRWLNRDEV
jgi:hypothetical protein